MSLLLVLLGAGATGSGVGEEGGVGGEEGLEGRAKKTSSDRELGGLWDGRFGIIKSQMLDVLLTRLAKCDKIAV